MNCYTVQFFIYIAMKRNRKHTVQAFTLMETLVVLVMTGIVATLGYWIFLNINKSALDYRVDSYKKLDFNMFLNQLKEDFKGHDNIVYTANKGVNILNEAHDKVYTYRFCESYAVRDNALSKDTFYIKQKNFSCTTVQEGTGVVDKINWKVIWNSEPLNIIITKKYSLYQLQKHSVIKNK